MPFRQIFVVLLALIAILLAALVVLSWDGDDDDTDATDGTTTVPDDATTTSTSTTTTVAPVAVEIPVDCGTDPDTEIPPPAVGPTLGRNSSLSTVGLDTVTFGLTVTQAEEASGHTMINCEPVSECYRVTPDGAPVGISFVVDAGTIERVDIVGESPVTTVSGAGIGTTGDELDQLFGENLERVDLGGGQVDVFYVPTDENDQDFRVAFTTVDGVVESMRAGRVPLVSEPEACT
ncbi:MAG: hypothetical protein RIB98_19575 [Acidimicrobiales bacterium]